MLIALAVLSSWASTDAVASGDVAWPQRFLEPWRWSRFSTTSGLPGTATIDVAEPAGGLPWALTTSGLAFFDGYEWHALDDDSGLPDGRPAAIAEGAGGDLLVIAGGDLFLGDETGFQRIGAANDAGGGPFHEVVALGGSRRIARRGTSLWQGDGSSWAPLVEERWQREERLYRLIGGGEGRVWAQTQDGTYLRLDGRWQPAPGGPAGDRLAAEASLRPGLILGLFASGRARLLDLTTTSAWSAPLPTPEPFRGAVDVARHGDEALWLAGDDGVHLFRFGATLWQQWEEPEAERLNHIETIAIARDGTAWMGTDRGLIARRPDGDKRQWVDASGVALGRITGLAEDAAGSMWVTSSEAFGGALELSGDTFRRHGLASGGAAPPLFRVRTDPGGEPWFTVGRAPGVLRLDDAGLVPWAPAAQLADTRVYDIAFVGDDEVWLATASGPARWRDGRWQLWTEETGLLDPDTWLIRAGADAVWLSDGLNGVGTIGADGRLRYEGMSDGLPSDAVRDLAIGPEGVLWVATEGGLGVRHPGFGWQTLSGHSGLPTPHLRSVAVAGQRIYVGTPGAGAHVLDLAHLPTTPPRLVGEAHSGDGGTVVISWRALAHEGFLYPGPPMSRVRLDDGPWSRWDTTRVVHIDDAAPGAHAYAIQTRIGLGSDAVAETTGAVHVPYPLYRRPEVAAPLMLLAGGLMAAVGVYAWRRRQFVRDLHASRSRLGMMLQQMPASLCVVRPDMTVSSVEGALAVDLGWTPERVIGRHVGELANASGDRDAFVAAHERALAGAAADLDQSIGGRDLRLHLDPLRDERGEIVGAICVALDLSDRARLERQLLQARKLEAIGTVAGGVAHDFNNLLLGVRGFTELAIEQLEHDHPVREDLAEVLRASDRATDLVAQLLTLGRRRPGRPRRIDLNVVLGEMRTLLEHLVGRSVHMDMRLMPHAAPVVIDRVHLEQLIVNLVANARDAMPEGGDLTVRTTQVDIDAAEAKSVPGAAPGRYACLHVRDNGVGIAPDVVDRIFEPFFSTRASTGGTGLGLATAYGVVQQSKGWIEVDSEPGGGTSFSVFLPWNEGPFTDADEVAVSGGTAPDPAAGGHARLLVIEQDDLVGALMRRWIGETGHSVVHGATIAALEEDLAGFDLVIVSVSPRDLAGVDLLGKLHDRAPGVRALIVSEQQAPAGLQAHLGRRVEFLAKPFSRDNLLARIESLLAS